MARPASWARPASSPGQTVFVNAVVTEPMRYIAVDRETLRRLLFDDASLSTCC